MSIYASPAFWKATAERAVRTAAQAAGAAIGATALAHEVDWLLVGSATALATILSVLTSIASAQVSDNGPSLAGEQLLEEVTK